MKYLVYPKYPDSFRSFTHVLRWIEKQEQIVM